MKMFKSLLELTEKLKTEQPSIKFFIEKRFLEKIECLASFATDLKTIKYISFQTVKDFIVNPALGHFPIKPELF